MQLMQVLCMTTFVVTSALAHFENDLHIDQSSEVSQEPWDCPPWGKWEVSPCLWPTMSYASIPAACKVNVSHLHIPKWVAEFVKAKIKEPFDVLKAIFKERGNPQSCGACSRKIKCRQRQMQDMARKPVNFHCKPVEIQILPDPCPSEKPCEMNIVKGGCPSPLPPLPHQSRPPPPPPPPRPYHYHCHHHHHHHNHYPRPPWPPLRPPPWRRLPHWSGGLPPLPPQPLPPWPKLAHLLVDQRFEPQAPPMELQRSPPLAPQLHPDQPPPPWHQKGPMMPPEKQFLWPHVPPVSPVAMPQYAPYFPRGPPPPAPPQLLVHPHFMQLPIIPCQHNRVGLPMRPPPVWYPRQSFTTGPLLLHRERPPIAPPPLHYGSSVVPARFPSPFLPFWQPRIQPIVQSMVPPMSSPLQATAPLLPPFLPPWHYRRRLPGSPPGYITRFCLSPLPPKMAQPHLWPQQGAPNPPLMPPHFMRPPPLLSPFHNRFPSGPPTWHMGKFPVGPAPGYNMLRFPVRSIHSTLPLLWYHRRYPVPSPGPPAPPVFMKLPLPSPWLHRRQFPAGPPALAPPFSASKPPPWHQRGMFSPQPLPSVGPQLPPSWQPGQNFLTQTVQEPPIIGPPLQPHPLPPQPHIETQSLDSTGKEADGFPIGWHMRPTTLWKLPELQLLRQTYLNEKFFPVESEEINTEIDQVNPGMQVNRTRGPWQVWNCVKNKEGNKCLCCCGFFIPNIENGTCMSLRKPVGEENAPEESFVSESASAEFTSLEKESDSSEYQEDEVLLSSAENLENDGYIETTESQAFLKKK